MSEQLEFQDWTGEGEQVVPESSSEKTVEVSPSTPTTNYEIYKCKECQDTGACARCTRGLQWIKDNPIKL